jgi:hypothetical protein
LFEYCGNSTDLDKEKLMYLVKDVGHIMIEYAIDETTGGRYPYCAACQKLLLPEDERIVLRKEQPTKQGIREGIFLCGNCAWGVTRIIENLLEEDRYAD